MNKKKGKNKEKNNLSSRENIKKSSKLTLKDQLSEEKDKSLRLFAEFDNYRKRTAKERLELFSTASQDIMTCLLPILDDFERAIESEDIEWIMDQHTDDIVRELPDGVKIVGKAEFRKYWEDFFEYTDNIDVETIDFVTSGLPPDKLALHWSSKLIL